MAEPTKSRKPIATRRNAGLKRILGHLGTWGCRVRHLKDEHEARQLLCAAFQIKNATHLSKLAEAVDDLGYAERRSRVCRFVQETAPSATLLWPINAKARNWKPAGSHPARKPAAIAISRARQAEIAKSRPIPRGGASAHINDQREALATEANKLLKKVRVQTRHRIAGGESYT